MLHLGTQRRISCGSILQGFAAWGEEDITFKRGNSGERHVRRTSDFIKMLQVQRREKCVIWSSQEGFMEEVKLDLLLKIIVK